MRRALVGLLVVLLGSLSCGRPPSATPEPGSPATDSDVIDPDLLAQLSTDASALALVELVADPLDGQALLAEGSVWTDDDLAHRAARLDARKADVKSAAPEAVEESTFTQLPMLALRITSADQLSALAAQPQVKHLHANRLQQAFLAQSLPLINQPAALAAGRSGTGATVAVLDTGLDYTRTAFGSCTAPGVPASCKVAWAQDFAPDDGALDDNGHGTNVSGIVLGVAPGARVIGLDVFTGGGAYTNHILAAIDWCIQNRTTYNIVALNMSLGGGSSSTPCANDAFSSSVTAAKNAGILSAIASGNNGYTSMLSSPACVPDAVSVGAVYDSNLGGIGWSMCSDPVTAADRVTCFSNSASFLTLLAPGSVITAAGISMSGTSQATPHVAGAIAVMAGAWPGESAALRLQRLVTSATTIVDPRNGISKPRLDLTASTNGCAYTVFPTSASTAAAAASLTFTVTAGTGCDWAASSNGAWASVQTGTAGSGAGSVTVAVQANVGAARSANLAIAGKAVVLSQAGDTVAPQGSVTIAAGAEWTKAAAVTLTLSATDNGSVSTMCVSNSSTCSTWVPYATSKTWSLLAGNGPKTVWAWFKDANGNISAAASDTIGLDATVPTNGTLTATSGDGQVALSWAGFADVTSGVAGYVVVASPTTAPTTCATGTRVATGAATSAVHGSLQNGLTFGYRVCALDAAGNLSTGVTATARTAPEFSAPTGSVAINAGAAWAKSTTVQLSLPATDASGVRLMCVSNTATCTAWVGYAPTLSWALTAGAGLRTVSAWFQDAWGNVSAPVSDTIMLDTTAPVGGAVVASRGDAQIGLSWSGFTDATSGLASYTVVMAPGAAPTSCALGTVIGSQLTATSFSKTGLTNGASYGFRVCAVDTAGNVSTGVTATAVPAPEFIAPTGNVHVSPDAVWSRSSAVTLALSATDASGVSTMCLSNTTACTAWVPYAATTSWALLSGSGLRTVYATFKDPWGNTSATSSASITVDTVAPTLGTLTATPGSKQVSLSWSGSTDAVSGLSGYTLVWATGTVAPASCAAGTLAWSGNAASFVHTALTSGQSVSYRLCGTDRAGNVSAGVIRTALVQ